MKFQLKWPHYLFLSILTCLFCYIALGAYYIIDINEGLYAQIPREMLQTGQYVIPHLNGVPYIEKPPLLYWLIAGCYKIFGVSAFSARCVPATAMLWCIVSIFWFGRKINLPQVGFLSAVMLSSSIGFWLIGRTILFDMVLTALLSSAFYLFYLWYIKNQKVYLRVAYIFLGLAVLCKGLLVLIIAPAIVGLFLLWERQFFSKLYRLLDIYGLLLLCLVALPWHILAVIQQPEFAWFYFINEHVGRFLNTRFPHDYHMGSIFYYLPRIFVYIFPWSFFLPFLYFSKSSEHAVLKKFLWLWFLIPLIFFSLAGDKGDYYMVISVPAVILLLALQLERLFIQKKAFPFMLVLILTVLLGMAGFGLLIIAFYTTVHFGREILIESNSVIPMLLYLLLGAYAIVGVTLVFKRQDQPMLAFCLLAASVLPMIFLFISAKEQLQINYTQHSIAQYILNQESEKGIIPVYSYQEYEKTSSLRFYLNQPLTIIDSKSLDLDFGQHTPESQGIFVSVNQFLHKIKHQSVYVVVLNDSIDDFNQAITRHTHQHFCDLLQTPDARLLRSGAKC